jgi:hypothetical protein
MMIVNIPELSNIVYQFSSFRTLDNFRYPVPLKYRKEWELNNVRIGSDVLVVVIWTWGAVVEVYGEVKVKHNFFLTSALN